MLEVGARKNESKRRTKWRGPLKYRSKAAVSPHGLNREKSPTSIFLRAEAARLHRYSSSKNVGDSLPSGCFAFIGSLKTFGG